MFGIRGKGLAIAVILLGLNATARAGDERVLYASLGDTARSPIGWVEFCTDNPGECAGGPSQPRDIVMSQTAWRDLLRVNHWVNETVKPMTDMDHWGVIEKWSLPTDGYGDCEDYVLMKRKLLIDAGWPRGADRQDRQGRVHSRQPERKRRGLDRDRISLRQAPVAERSECVGFAGRQPTRAGHRQRPRSLTHNEITETRDPVTSPPLPVPDRIARGQLSPKSWPQLFQGPGNPDFV